MKMNINEGLPQICFLQQARSMGKSVLRRILGDGGGLGGLVGVYITHQLVACDGLLGQKVESYPTF